MKKILSIIACAVMLFCLVSCNGGALKEYVELKNDETLVVDGEKYVNRTSTVTTPQYLSYLKDVKYVLRRSLSAYSGYDYVEFGGYYYYWVAEEIKDQEKLGDMTVKTDVTYDYLTYGEENVNVNVRQKVKTEVSYSYQGGFVEKAFTYSIVLNGYFESVEKATELCPDLMTKIDTTGTKKYYVDVVTPERVDYSTDSYTDTYFYFE